MTPVERSHPPDRGDAPGALMARLARPTAETPTRLAVISDVHLSVSARGTRKVFHRTEERLRTAVEDANALDVDGVLFGGDLTKDGERADFERFDEVLAGLEPPFVAIPGNHDVPKAFDDHPVPGLDRFTERYTPGELPSVARFGGVDLVCLDSETMPDGSLAETWEGRVAPDQLEWLRNTLPDVPNPVVCVHHNLARLPEVAEFEGYPWEWYPILNAEELVDVLSEHGVPLVLSGHHHLPATSYSRGVREIVAPATCSFPQAYLLVDVDRGGTTVWLVPLADRDGVREAYNYARKGGATDQGILEMALTRLERFPLVRE